MRQIFAENLKQLAMETKAGKLSNGMGDLTANLKPGEFLHFLPSKTSDAMLIFKYPHYNRRMSVGGEA